MSELRTRLSQIQGEIEEKTKAAQLKWAAFEKSRDIAVASKKNVDLNVSDAAHAEYAAKAAELQTLTDARDDIFKQLANNPAGVTDPFGGGSLLNKKSIGARIEESSFSLQELKRSGALTSNSQRIQGVKLGEIGRAEFKALITGLSDTSAGAFIDSDRKPYVAQPQRMPGLLDLLLVGETNSDVVTFARQTTYTNAAAEVAEATATDTGTKPEATIAFENVTSNVSTIAHWVPATRQSLADPGNLRTIIESQLTYGVRYRLESQVINGNGTAPNLRGILNTTGILTQAKGSDSVSDAVHKAMTQLQVAEVEPNAVVMHPNDWQVTRLERDGGGSIAGTGAYLYGSPGESAPRTMWGLPVVVSTAVPDDTAIVGDFRKAALWIREAVQILVSDSHDDFFVKNLVAILAEMRVAFGVLMPNAFAKVTSVD